MTLMTNNLVPTVSELQSFKIIAEVAASNPHWKKVGGSGSQDSIVSTILSIMLLARELGISPIQAVSGGINNIQGRYEISARLMNQLIRKQGHKIAIKQSTNEFCMIWSKRKDTGEEHEEKYHIEEAIRSGLVKEGSAWKKTPSDMLFARCISRLARRLYPDAIGGCYVEGELQESIQNKIVSPEAISDVSDLKKEIDVKVDHFISLVFPAHINSDEALAYIEESAACNDMPVEKVKKKAAENMDGFVKAFEKWKEKKNPIYPLPKVTEEVEISADMRGHEMMA